MKNFILYSFKLKNKEILELCGKSTLNFLIYYFTNVENIADVFIY